MTYALNNCLGAKCSPSSLSGHASLHCNSRLHRITGRIMARLKSWRIRPEAHRK